MASDLRIGELPAFSPVALPASPEAHESRTPAPKPTPVRTPSAPSETDVLAAEAAAAHASREQDLAILRRALSSNVPELELPNRKLSIAVNASTHELEIQVLDALDGSVVRSIPPQSLPEVIHPNTLPRGTLLRLVQGEL